MPVATKVLVINGYPHPRPDRLGAALAEALLGGVGDASAKRRAAWIARMRKLGREGR